LLLLEELNNRLQCNLRCESDRVNERAGGDGRNRDVAQTVLGGDLQAPPVGACQQLWLMLVAPSPNRSHSMNNVTRLQVPSCRNDRITNGTTTNMPTLLINPRSAFGVDSPVCTAALVQPPVCGGDNRIGILVGDVTGDETKHGLSYWDLHC